jgi:hypothetical protein
VGSGGGGKAYRLDAEMMRDGKTDVQPDGPTTRGAATSWRVYLGLQQRYAKVLPLVGNDIPTNGYASL